MTFQGLRTVLQHDRPSEGSCVGMLDCWASIIRQAPEIVPRRPNAGAPKAAQHDMLRHVLGDIAEATMLLYPHLSSCSASFPAGHAMMSFGDSAGAVAAWMLALTQDDAVGSPPLVNEGG